MVATVTDDKFFNEARIVERNGQILEIDRLFYVEGLTGGSRTLERALNESASVPDIGDLHPDATGTNALADLRVEDRIAVALSPTKAKVTVTYRWQPSRFTFIDMGGGVESVVTERTGPNETDPAIVLEHPHVNPDKSGNRKQGARINVTVPRFTMVGMNVLDLTSGEAQAVRHVQRFLNKMNGDSLMGGDQEQWLCTSGEYEPFRDATDPNLIVRARFIFGFQHKEEKWSSNFAVVTRRDGTPHPDATTGNMGIVKVPFYSTFNFSELNTITA